MSYQQSYHQEGETHNNILQQQKSPEGLNVLVLFDFLLILHRSETTCN